MPLRHPSRISEGPRAGKNRKDRPRADKSAFDKVETCVRTAVCVCVCVHRPRLVISVLASSFLGFAMFWCLQGPSRYLGFFAESQPYDFYPVVSRNDMCRVSLNPGVQAFPVSRHPFVLLSGASMLQLPGFYLSAYSVCSAAFSAVVWCLLRPVRGCPAKDSYW